MPGAFGAVLFDWRGTLFHDEDDAAWIRASAASISQTLTTHGIVSDIHYPLRPHFDRYGLGTFVDSYTLSFEHGLQKPHPRLFQIALDQLGVTPRESLIVGDRAVRDSGAATLGITTLILPPVPNHSPRGLDIVLRLLSSA